MFPNTSTSSYRAGNGDIGRRPARLYVTKCDNPSVLCRVAGCPQSQFVVSNQFTYLTGVELDDNLKKLMRDLGAAINDALSGSEEISEAMQNVRDSGNDVFLVLEATIGWFNRRSEGESAEEDDRPLIGSEIKLNTQDMKFLKSLKIKGDDL